MAAGVSFWITLQVSISDQLMTVFATIHYFAYYHKTAYLGRSKLFKGQIIFLKNKIKNIY